MAQARAKRESRDRRVTVDDAVKLNTELAKESEDADFDMLSEKANMLDDYLSFDEFCDFAQQISVGTPRELEKW